ncbi:hypothetical protein BDV30DRAFT_207718 [Aspergillus minisclerotigenes]|uniref:Uncharacterized protein n=1 Tax=Aspergillus minisclerotigenes TaxID=656917 RepID=A0A5N6JCY3_9EURO|nr:hypothetical protein BDV30DRAFT_207718 [Aspergillus minisclerotigenes]
MMNDISVKEMRICHYLYYHWPPRQIRASSFPNLPKPRVEMWVSKQPQSSCEPPQVSRCTLSARLNLRGSCSRAC